MEANNTKAMREALVKIRGMIMDDGVDGRSPAYIVNICDTALSDPPRNCDVGTAEEQCKRFRCFCDMTKCQYCPLVYAKGGCALKWAQMPYEEGGAE